ncbi:MAG TPA: YeeE/YedE family protein [Polyangiales bacterium]|nr:YeeE/YedE family protein [Polyangiales bacterium]
MSNFTPLPSLLGGMLIGLAATLLLIGSGRVAGVSGILAGLLTTSDRIWRGLFVLGLLAAGAFAAWLAPDSIGGSPRSLPVLAIAGLLVGVGTRLGDGCTSGHGVCGLSRMSPRSLAATLTFVAVGMLTAYCVRALGANT